MNSSCPSCGAWVDGAGSTALFDMGYSALAAAGGTLYVADYSHGAVRTVDAASGATATLIGSYTQYSWGRAPVNNDIAGVGTAASIYLPAAIAVPAAGGVAYVAGQAVLWAVDLTTAATTRLRSLPKQCVYFYCGLAITPDGATLYAGLGASSVYAITSGERLASPHATPSATASPSPAAPPPTPPPSPTPWVRTLAGGGRAGISSCATRPFGLGGQSFGADLSAWPNDGAASSAVFCALGGIHAAPGGTVYIADQCAVRAYDGASVRTVFGRPSSCNLGGGVGTSASLASPIYSMFHDGTLGAAGSLFMCATTAVMRADLATSQVTNYVGFAPGWVDGVGLEARFGMNSVGPGSYITGDGAGTLCVVAVVRHSAAGRSRQKFGFGVPTLALSLRATLRTPPPMLRLLSRAATSPTRSTT